MKTIYRYEINKDINDVKLPVGAKILAVGTTLDWKYASDNEADDTKVFKEIINLWALVDTDQSFETRRFLVFGTGADMDSVATYDLEYIGMVVKSNDYRFHVFEVK